MNELSAGGAHSTGPNNGMAVRATYESLEELQAVSEAAGWDVDYRQIQRGKMSTFVFEAECAAVKLHDEGASGRFEVVGTSPEEHVTMLTSRGPGKVWINGATYGDTEFLVVGPGTEVHAVTDPHSGGLTMHVPMSLLEVPGYPDIRDAYPPNRSSKAIAPAAMSTRLRGLIRAAIYQPVAVHWQAERASALAAALVRLIDAYAGAPQDPSSIPAPKRLRILKKAREYVEAHLDEPIRIEKICGYCGSSYSLLERTFRRELKMTPCAYLRARRLAAVNRELKRADPCDTTISEVALAHGFTHLGRFSGAYREQFGERPSETLGLA